VELTSTALRRARKKRGEEKEVEKVLPPREICGLQPPVYKTNALTLELWIHL